MPDRLTSPGAHGSPPAGEPNLGRHHASACTNGERQATHKRRPSRLAADRRTTGGWRGRETSGVQQRYHAATNRALRPAESGLTMYKPSRRRHRNDDLRAARGTRRSFAASRASRRSSGAPHGGLAAVAGARVPPQRSSSRRSRPPGDRLPARRETPAFVASTPRGAPFPHIRPWRRSWRGSPRPAAAMILCELRVRYVAGTGRALMRYLCRALRSRR